jgi:hypothetical protein
MLRNRLQDFEHKYFYSIVDRDDAQSIPDYFAANIENFLIRNRGQLEMRGGITARGTNPAKTILGACAYIKSNGSKKLVRVIDGAGNTAKFQYSDDGVTWTDITGGGSKTTAARWALVQANDNLYGVNGTDTAVKYDGTTMSTVAAIPQGTAIEWWKNHLWVFANPTIKDRLYYSDPSTPETFGGSSFLNINLGDISRGIGLRGTAGSTGRLYVGKERSVWYITGTSSSDWAVQPLTYEHGVASHDSMVQLKNEVWCVDLEGNVRQLYRTQFDVPLSNLASKDISMTTAGLNKAQLSKAQCVFYDNYLMVFVPNGVDSYNSLVMVFDTLANEKKGGWIKFTNWNISYGVVFNESNTPKLFLFDSRTNNGQAYEWTGTSDNGSAIIAKYETKIYDFGYSDQEKRFKFSYQFAPAQGSVTSRFYTSIDRYYYTKIADPSLLGTGNKLLGTTWTLGTDKLGSGGFVKVRIPFTDNGGSGLGTTVQIKIEAESSTAALKLQRFVSHYMLMGLR